MAEEKICNHCKDPRCIGWYLLHPKEIIMVPRIKQKNLEINDKRTFNLIDSPSSGEIFTVFKELHVLHAPDENKDDANCAKVYVKDLIEKIQKGV